MKGGYWYQRAKTTRASQQHSYLSTSVQMTGRQGTTGQEMGESAITRQQQSGMSYLEKKSKQLMAIMSRVSKIEDYYQILCGEDYAKLAVRCFEHNNEIILYCVNDHKLLCANCMFTVTTNASNSKSKGSMEGTMKLDQSRGTNMESNAGNLSNTFTSSKHSNHEVRQTQKSGVEIANDIKIWQFELQEKAAELATCQMEWEKCSQNFSKIKDKLFQELDKQYDRLQMQLSTRYMKMKSQIAELTKPCQQNLDRIMSSYKAIKRLLIPHRYPIPTVKHCWLEHMKKLLLEMPVNFKEISSSWIKSFEAQVRVLLRRFSSAPFDPKT